MPHATCHMNNPSRLHDEINPQKTQTQNKKQRTKKQFVTFVMLLLLLQVSKSIIPRNGTPEHSVATIFNWNTFKTFSIKSRENKSQRRAEEEKERERERVWEREEKWKAEKIKVQNTFREFARDVRFRWIQRLTASSHPFPLFLSYSLSLACSFSVCLPLRTPSLACWACEWESWQAARFYCVC